MFIQLILFRLGVLYVSRVAVFVITNRIASSNFTNRLTRPEAPSSFIYLHFI